MQNEFLSSAKQQFDYYKQLAEKTFSQLSDEQLFWKFNEESNSIAIIVKHMTGNMLSRWTDLFSTDGEKEWRMRDEDLEKVVFIRQQPLTVTAAINRQLAHYPYHVGQIVFIGKMCLDANWKSLSIPKRIK